MFHENENETANIFEDMCYKRDNGILPTQVTTFNPVLMYQSPGVDTLTPTALDNFEQTFNEFQNHPVPTQELMQIKSEPDDTSSNFGSDQSFSVSRKRGDHFVVPNIDPETYLVTNSRRPTGPRKLKYNGKLSADDDRRRSMRRERNRLAAAKCRQRRDDHTMRLIQETEGLEEEQSQLENDVEKLQAQKEQLEMILRAHQASCNKNNMVAVNTNYSNNQSNTYIAPPSDYVTQQNTFVPQPTNTYVSQPLTYVTQPNTYQSQPAITYVTQSNAYLPQSTSQSNMMDFSASVLSNQKDLFNFDAAIDNEALRQIPFDFSAMTTTCSAEMKRHSTDSSISSEMSPKILCS